MSSWTVEIGEFPGGFRIYRNEDNIPCYYDNRLTYMKISAYWYDNMQSAPIEIGRATISMDGVEIIGPQVCEEVDFSIVVEYQYHKEGDIRRIENIFVDEDVFHIGDGLTLSRTGSLPMSKLCEIAGLTSPAISWRGSIGAVSISPILHEGLAEEDIFPLYGMKPRGNRILVTLVDEEE